MPVLDSLRYTIDSLGIPGGITVKRTTSLGADADGDPRAGIRKSFRLRPAVVQPARGRDLLRLPEGDRTLETILVHTKEKLRTAEGGTFAAADQILYCPGGDGEQSTYVVIMAADWAIIGGFFSVLAQKRERQ